MSQVSYHTDENGILRIFYGNKILAEISQCESKTNVELENMVSEVLADMGYTWQYDGTLTRNETANQRVSPPSVKCKNKHNSKLRKHHK